jgi:hypothetical protein
MSTLDDQTIGNRAGTPYSEPLRTSQPHDLITPRTSQPHNP